MTVIQGAVKTPAGAPVQGATVAVDLVKLSDALPGFTATATVTGVSVAVTDALGAWTVDLTPNATITPTGTYYRVRESLPGRTAVHQYAVIVPATGGPYNVSSVLAASPAAVSAATIPWNNVTGKPDLSGTGGPVDWSSITGKPTIPTQASIDAKLPLTNPEILDTTFTVRKSDNSSAVRFRSTGGAVDIDKFSGDVVISSFAGPGFSGVQTGLQRWRSDGTTLAGNTQFGANVYGSTAAVDGATGNASFNNLTVAGTSAGLKYADLTGKPVDSLSLLDVGEEVFPRMLPASGGALTGGSVSLSFFTARRTETINNLRTFSSTTASAGLTLAKMGVYLVNGDGSLTKVAETASDTALWSTINTIHSRATLAPWSKVAGQRYAFATIAIGTTMPLIIGTAISSNYSGVSPRISARVASQTDLPATIATASFIEDFRINQGFVLP